MRWHARHPEFCIQAAARVGVGFLIMLSNICVATITGFPCSLANLGHILSAHDDSDAKSREIRIDQVIIMKEQVQ